MPKLLHRTWQRLAELKETINPNSNMTKKGNDTREENPPRGGFDVVEWKEGSDKVIEKRGPPGEDVSLRQSHLCPVSDQCDTC